MVGRVKRASTYVRPSEETAAAIEAEYRAGVTAPVLAEKYGVKASWIYKYAWLGKWREDGVERPAWREAATPVEAAEAAALATGESVRAMMEGCDARARSCAWLAETHARTAVRLAAALRGLGPAVVDTAHRDDPRRRRRVAHATQERCPRLQSRMRLTLKCAALCAPAKLNRESRCAAFTSPPLP